MKAIYLVYSLPVFVIAGLVLYFPSARKLVTEFFTATKLAVIGFALLAVGLYLAFFTAPITTLTDGKTPDLAWKIFYYHVPVAISSFLAFILAAVFGGIFLAKGDRRWDHMSYVSVEVGFLFGFLVEWTGVMWDKAAWGVWWQWEPRLTTYLILMLMYAGYFVLRSAMTEDASRARFASVYSIIAAASVPLTFFSTRLIESAHPVVFSSSGAEKVVFIPAFLTAVTGMLLFAAALISTRYSLLLLGEEADYLKDKLGG